MCIIMYSLTLYLDIQSTIPSLMLCANLLLQKVRLTNRQRDQGKRWSGCREVGGQGSAVRHGIIGWYYGDIRMGFGSSAARLQFGRVV